jgi:hypothetical protein
MQPLCRKSLNVLLDGVYKYATGTRHVKADAMIEREHTCSLRMKYGLKANKRSCGDGTEFRYSFRHN